MTRFILNSPFLLLLVLLASIFFLPGITTWISIAMLAVSICIAIFLSSYKHWKSYQQAECTREKMLRNLTFDLLGFLIVMGAAIYAGRLAGAYIGLRAGLWFGLFAGFAGGFLSAWTIRFAWSKLVLSRA